MKIDFASKITGLDGSAIVEMDQPLTLGNVVASACATSIPEGKIPGDNPLRAGELAMMLYSAKSIEISVQDAALIQNRLPFRWAPHVQFQAHTILEAVQNSKSAIKDV